MAGTRQVWPGSHSGRRWRSRTSTGRSWVAGRRLAVRPCGKLGIDLAGEALVSGWPDRQSAGEAVPYLTDCLPFPCPERHLGKLREFTYSNGRRTARH